jgi:hypothetical protein
MAKTKDPEAPGIIGRTIDAVRSIFDGSSEPTPADWLALSEALDNGDAATARRFLADANLPRELAGPLARIKQRARELEAVAANRPTQDELDKLRAELAILRRAQFPDMAAAQVAALRLAEVEPAEREASRRFNEAKHAEILLVGLKYTFAELFSGAAGGKALSMLDAVCANALVDAGFSPQELFARPWTLAYRLQRQPEQRRRATLQASSQGSPRR